MYEYFHRHPDKETKGIRQAYEATCLEFLHYAAKLGHAAAQHTLGMIHYQGSCGQRRAPAKAELWFRRAAKCGHADAQYRLGLLFRDGDGVAEDIEQARRWFGCAVKLGLEDVETEDAETNLIMLDPDKGVADWKKAADRGNAEALYRLGRRSKDRFDKECDLIVEDEHYPPEQDEQVHPLEEEEVNMRKQQSRGNFWSTTEKPRRRGHVAAQYELGQIHSEGKVLF